MTFITPSLIATLSLLEVKGSQLACHTYSYKNRQEISYAASAQTPKIYIYGRFNRC